MLRPILKIFKKHLLLLLIIVFVLSFLFVSIWKRTASVDEDAEELDIDLLKNKIIQLKRSHFLNKPIQPEDFENESFEQTQNHTLNHKRLFNNTLDLGDFTSENCRNSVQGKLLITDERGKWGLQIFQSFSLNLSRN